MHDSIDFCKKVLTGNTDYNFKCVSQQTLLQRNSVCDPNWPYGCSTNWLQPVNQCIERVENLF